MKKRLKPCWPLILITLLFAASIVSTFVGCSSGGSTKSGGGSTKPGGGYDPPPPAPTPHELFADTFNGIALDQSIWVAHGNGVTLDDGCLCIESFRPWVSGVESVEHFFSPREGDKLTVEGSVVLPEDTQRSEALVYVQNHWRHDDPDCYYLEFIRNNEHEGDNDVYFGVRSNGSRVEYIRLSSFAYDEPVEWVFTIYAHRCVVEVGTSFHQTEYEVHDLGLSIHGSGSEAYWEYVDVTLWDVHF